MNNPTPTPQDYKALWLLGGLLALWLACPLALVLIYQLFGG